MTRPPVGAYTTGDVSVYAGVFLHFCFELACMES